MPSINQPQVSLDGLHLAAGDLEGNIRIYDLAGMKLLAMRDAVHDGEVMTLAFSPHVREKSEPCIHETTSSMRQVYPSSPTKKKTQNAGLNIKINKKSQIYDLGLSPSGILIR
jgi:hypothetical protein